MQTTLVIDDQLLKAAEERAASLRTTLSEIVNDALRRCLHIQPAGRPPFQMITFGDPSAAEHHEPADFAASQEDDDTASLAR